MAYTQFGASRSAINNAGLVLRDHWQSAVIADSVALDAAFEKAWLYRSEFQLPLTKVVMGMRSFLNTEGAPVVVAQRLKRMPTILDKLTRHPNMKLTYMQDIGGCRAILPGWDRQVMGRVLQRIERRKWDVKEVYDYIKAPKPSGYRGIHVVVMRDHRLVEIQLRSEAQHQWAETVERLGSRTGYNLKDGQGPEDLLHYLERAAYGTNLQELGRPVTTAFMLEFSRLQATVRHYFVRP